MNEINLLRYHNRSAHEIHMLLSGELTNDFFSRVVVIENNKKVSRHPKLTFFLTLLIALICSLAVSYVLYMKFIDVHHSIKPEVIRDQIKHVINLPDVKTVVKTKPDPYVMEGYSSVGDLELGSGSEARQGTIIISDYNNQPKPVVVKPEETIKPLTNPGEPVKRIPVTEPAFMPVYSGTFMMRFSDADAEDSATIKEIAVKNDLKLSRTGTQVKNVTSWQVYKFMKSSPYVVAGRHTSFMKEFASKEDAVSYMTAAKMKGIIIPKRRDVVFYDWEVCCTKQDQANTLAGASGLNMNNVKIIQIKQ